MVEDNRRSFLKWAIHGLGAIFTAVLGFPIVMYLIDPRHREQKKGAFRAVDGIDLTDTQKLAVNQPVQGRIRDVRRDAWTLHPSDVIGRVWVIKTREWGAGGPDPAKKEDPDLLVFTTVCTHLGCSINLKTNAGTPEGFACPCHNGQFHLNGAKVEGGTNPAPRGMDSLEWELDKDNNKLLLVRYVNFRQLEAEKIEKK